MVTWNIAERAKAKGWTNAYQLAKRTGISQPLAKRIMESERVERIDVVTLESLARVFKVKPWALLTWSDG